ncbi:MAG: hypothetical protein II721_01310 [Bacilli bacterium]|nr:hypothetical protein [Bacilli bacterium]
MKTMEKFARTKIFFIPYKPRFDRRKAQFLKTKENERKTRGKKSVAICKIHPIILPVGKRTLLSEKATPHFDSSSVCFAQSGEV